MLGGHCSQARICYFSLTAPEQLHDAPAVALEFSAVEPEQVRASVLGQSTQIDDGLSTRGWAALGLPAPAEIKALEQGSCRFSIGGWSWAGVTGLLATVGAEPQEVEPAAFRDAFRDLVQRSGRAGGP